MKNIWHDLQKPIFILAPMEDVTDTVFRRIILTLGKPDLFFTEFTNCEALLSEGRKRVEHRLQFEVAEKPLIAQIWGTKPEQYEKVTDMLVGMGFDGVDINMGCPERSVVKQGACSALIKNPSLAKEIIDATKRGANGRIPVSVKTRLGFKEVQTDEWIPFLLEQDITALTIHGRTVLEMSKVPAHWEEIAKAVKMRNEMGVQTLIIGNGDVASYDEGVEKVEQYGLDGIMVGRGIFHNPWLFDRTVDPTSITVRERLEVLLRHVTLYHTTWGKRKNYQILKKYFKIYLQGFPGASEMRVQFMETKNADEAIQLASRLLSTDHRLPSSQSI
jgi:nifR3 family TIM-barrel protein